MNESGHDPGAGDVESSLTIPHPGAPWYPDILDFAVSFDGYDVYGERLGKVAHSNWERFRSDGALPSSMTELRATLFFLHRFIRWNEEFSDGPSDDEMRFAHALVEAIRSQWADIADTAGA